MSRRITLMDLGGVTLTHRDANFVIEYVKDFNARRAAKCSGLSPDSCYTIRDKPEIQQAIQHVLLTRLEVSAIDAEWVLMEAVDNHMIARQMGNINASNAALGLIMKHTLVDAVASDKLNMNIHADKDIMKRLTRGRERVLAEVVPLKLVNDKPIDADNDDSVSFL